MSTGAIVAVVAAVIIVIAIVAVVMMKRDGAGGPGLKRRFGPEYEWTLARNDGDIRATRRELAERVKRYGDLETRALPAEAQERYAARWNAVKAQFVDDPSAALTEADQLIGQLAAERGYPAANTAEHVDALSVHHPHHVHGYREAHAAVTGDGRHGTEDLRTALVSARGLFDELLQGGGRGTRRAAELETADTADVEPDAESVPAQDETKQVRGKRLAALTGRGRTEEEQ
ncbi:hypothetical protein [Streptomyces sp. NBC_01477]|uniref:hypothetical protein n=1 Tax=Streptomyces sp. NBC_01477 TaxID=2976015 RepID=UPI002E3130BF|nr:hypothetical protein [Streptomyces sp. NBC_01477]